MNKPLYGVLLLFSLLCGIGGILTLIPVSGASYPNVLGYSSLCTFAPVATLYCFLAAGITCVLRASLVKRAAYNQGRPVFKAAPIVVLVVVAILAVASHFWFLNVKSQYTSGVSAASEAMESEQSTE